MNKNQNKPLQKSSISSDNITLVPIFKEKIDTEKLAKAIIMFQEYQQKEEEKLKHSLKNKDGLNKTDSTN